MQKAQKLIVVAHPDDESIFFGGLILSEPHTEWTVVCCTNGNSEGRAKQRALEFKKACRSLGVQHAIQFDFPDLFNKRLNVRDLSTQLKKIVKQKNWKEIYTHSPIGEYGHIHHQDVCYATYQVAEKVPVLSVAYNCAAQKKVVLGEKLYQKKLSILNDVYFLETARFLNFLPCTFSEGFSKLDLSEVTALYGWLVRQKKFNAKSLKFFRDLWPVLKDGTYQKVAKRFFKVYF